MALTLALAEKGHYTVRKGVSLFGSTTKLKALTHNWMLSRFLLPFRTRQNSGFITTILHICLLNCLNPAFSSSTLTVLCRCPREGGRKWTWNEGRKEVRREVQEITASSYLHNSEILVNIFIKDSGDAIVRLLDLWRTWTFFRFKLEIRIIWKAVDVTWKILDIVRKGGVEVQHLGRCNQLQ